MTISVRRWLERLRTRDASVVKVESPSAKQVCVVFTRPDRAVAKLDIARGPCVPSPGRKRPLVGVYSQQALILDQVQALFRILVPDPAAQAWDSATSRSNATLRTFSMAFLEALIGDYREGVERAGQVGVSRRPITDAQARFMLEPRFDIARRWLQAGSWPDGATPEGVIGHFVAWGGLANAARERGQRLYCWFGPGVPLKTIRFQRVPGEPERLVQIK